MDWLTQFLELMHEDIQNRNATFHSSMAYYDPATEERFVVLGQTRGVITKFPQAPIEKGIPASSVFLPTGQDFVFAAMGKVQKNKVSHRGKAAKEMENLLIDLA